MERHVKGVLFADYVRMIRGTKDVDWSRLLPPEDVAYLTQRIEPAKWYPMESFERMGDAILSEVANHDMNAVRMWGRFQVEPLARAFPSLVVVHDPVETLMRFRVLRATFFDFDALEIPMLHDDEAQIVVRYHMGQPAEEAASHQTLGFFEGLLETVGATEVQGRFAQRSWAGDPRTLLELHWSMR